MNPDDLPQAQQFGARMAGALGILGAVYDPVAIQWDQARREVRVFLLGAIGMPGLWADRAWRDLPAEKRGEIRLKAGDLYSWLGRWVGK